jgi:hypothetical protein
VVLSTPTHQLDAHFLPCLQVGAQEDLSKGPSTKLAAQPVLASDQDVERAHCCCGAVRSSRAGCGSLRLLGGWSRCDWELTQLSHHRTGVISCPEAPEAHSRSVEQQMSLKAPRLCVWRALLPTTAETF